MQSYNSVRNLFQSNIANLKACFKARKIRLPFFSCRSLLLSTSVLNDIQMLLAKHYVVTEDTTQGRLSN